MLSIIISSHKPNYFTAIEKNIAETCGIPYEIIKIDNPGIMGICEAYNRGAEQAKCDYLLFVHEDVKFVTNNWGKILIDKLSNENIGVIGVAGGKYVPSVPFAWWETPSTSLYLIQYDKDKFCEKYSIDSDKDVVHLDGVFLSCRHSIWQNFKFNSNIDGFHGYDIDFSIRVAHEFQNIVISDILIIHYSYGTADAKWIDSLIKYRHLFSAPPSQKINKANEAYLFYKFKQHLKLSKISKNEKIKLLIRYNNPKFIGYRAFTRNILSIFIEILKL